MTDLQKLHAFCTKLGHYPSRWAIQQEIERLLAEERAAGQALIDRNAIEPFIVKIIGQTGLREVHTALSSLWIDITKLPVQAHTEPASQGCPEIHGHAVECYDCAMPKKECSICEYHGVNAPSICSQIICPQLTDKADQYCEKTSKEPELEVTAEDLGRAFRRLVGGYQPLDDGHRGPMILPEGGTGEARP